MFSVLIISYKNITKIFCEGKSLLDYWNFLVLERPIIIFFLFVEYLERISYFSFRIMISTISILREWWRELWWTKKGEEGAKGREEARLYRLGRRHIEEPWEEEGPHPFAGSRLFMLRDSCGSTASSRVESGGGGGGGGNYESFARESFANQKVESCSRSWKCREIRWGSKKWRGFLFFFFLLSSRFDYSYGDERRNNRGIGFAGYHRWNIAKLFPVYFYMFVNMNMKINTLFIYMEFERKCDNA